MAHGSGAAPLASIIVAAPLLYHVASKGAPTNAKEQRALLGIAATTAAIELLVNRPRKKRWTPAHA